MSPTIAPNMMYLYKFSIMLLRNMDVHLNIQSVLIKGLIDYPTEVNEPWNSIMRIGLWKQSRRQCRLSNI